MKGYEKIALFTGFALTIIGAGIFWMMDVFLGGVFTLFVIGVAVWYLRLKNKGNLYLKDVAVRLGCRFEGGGFAYGCVRGVFEEGEIEIRVCRDFNSLRGLGGFALSSVLLESAIGVLAGMRNFTCVKIRHCGRVKTLPHLRGRVFMDEETILYLPISNDMTGLPLLKAGALVLEIKKAIS